MGIVPDDAQPSVSHPSWCARLPSEAADESHSSRPLRCNPAGDELLGVTVALQQAWPPFDSYFAVMLTITEDSRDLEYPLTVGQARVIGRAMRTLVRLHDRLTAPREGEPS